MFGRAIAIGGITAVRRATNASLCRTTISSCTSSYAASTAIAAAVPHVPIATSVRSASASVVPSSSLRMANVTRVVSMSSTTCVARRQMASSSAKGGLVPIIDLKSFAAKDKASVAEAIGKAAREIGFFGIIGHGIPAHIIANVEKASRDYFDLPANEKKKIQMTEDYPFGYSGYQEENLAAGYGVTRLPDLKEMFCIGPYNPSAGMPAIRWPTQPAHLRAAYLEYYQALEQLAAKLLQLFALALKLPENYFDDKITRHRSALRVLNYPQLSQMPPPGQIRAGEHTDYGSLTILLQDKVGGLQVRDKKGNWVDVAPAENAFVINIGDLMQRWTNDEFVSTLHRVIAPQSMARRQSLAFFHNIDHDARVECLPTCATASNPAKYGPVLAGEYLMQKHLASQGPATVAHAAGIAGNEKK